MGAGQFCTNPGIAIVFDDLGSEAFTQAAITALSDVKPQVMLTEEIATAFREGCKRTASVTGVQALLASSCDLRSVAPYLYRTTAKSWLENHALSEEVFGPLGLVVTVENMAEMRELALSLSGQLTVTIHMDDCDTEAVRDLLPILERKAGRLLVNGFPTGVEVCESMVHGGPYPASTNFGATSVGTMDIRRWLRHVCYQNFPAKLLPKDLDRS
jgi:NADP-dependent aldehyde dehydrogenase